LSKFKDSARTNSDVGFPMSANKKDDLDSFKLGKPKSLTLSEYQGSYEDANPHKLKAQNFTQGYLILTRSFENMIEKISDRLPADSLQKMSEMTSKLAIAINGFDTIREDEFRTKLQLRLKPIMSSQKSS